MSRSRPDHGSGENAELPAYLRIAGILRASIASGRIAPGGRLPSETQIMMRHQVSRSVAKWAVAVLKTDGLVDGRQGAGVFVRTPRRLTREPATWQLPTQVDDFGELDLRGHRPMAVCADDIVAKRLGVAPGQTVLRIVSCYIADGAPLCQVTSWRPLGELDGSAGGAARVDELCETVTVRAASPDEIVALALPARGSVFAIARTYSAQGVPMETADVVIRSDRCELIYRMPIADP